MWETLVSKTRTFNETKKISVNEKFFLQIRLYKQKKNIQKTNCKSKRCKTYRCIQKKV